MMADFFTWLANTQRFSSLIDIGANDGAFGAFLQRRFAIETVHAIEPLSKHGSALRQRDFIVHSCALSDSDGAAELIISENDAGSSLLAPSQRCLDEYPQIRSVDREMVQVRPLDGLPLDPLPAPLLIKMDAQGLEPAIIRGGRQTFAKAQAVYVETSFVPLYEGSGLFGDVHAELSALGFELRGFRAQHEGANGEPLFAHVIYLRR
jgi:FkbM family methyltransferase